MKKLTVTTKGLIERKIKPSFTWYRRHTDDLDAYHHERLEVWKDDERLYSGVELGQGLEDSYTTPYDEDVEETYEPNLVRMEEVLSSVPIGAVLMVSDYSEGIYETWVFAVRVRDGWSIRIDQ